MGGGIGYPPELGAAFSIPLCRRQTQLSCQVSSGSRLFLKWWRRDLQGSAAIACFTWCAISKLTAEQMALISIFKNPLLLKICFSFIHLIQVLTCIYSIPRKLQHEICEYVYNDFKLAVWCNDFDTWHEWFIISRMARRKICVCLINCFCMFMKKNKNKNRKQTAIHLQITENHSFLCLSRGPVWYDCKECNCFFLAFKGMHHVGLFCVANELVIKNPSEKSSWPLSPSMFHYVPASPSLPFRSGSSETCKRICWYSLSFHRCLSETDQKM